MCDKCLEWDLEEKEELSKRILRLSNLQIEKLFKKAGIKYMVPMDKVIEEIREEQEGSMNLDTLLTEADSKNNLLYWLTELEKQKMFKVLRVIDGDTIEVSIRGNTEKLRLLSIDTPESVDPRKPVQCFAKEATTKLSGFVANKYVKLVDDQQQGNRDKYSRLLRYVYDGKLFVNREMVRLGYAFSYKQYPTKFLEEFNKLEREARSKNIGLWSSSCNY